MARMKFIKLWCQETIHGTTLNELQPDERAVWFEFLCLAGDSVAPGSICITKGLGYSSEQLCTILKVQAELLERAIRKMIKCGKVKYNGSGIIEVLNFDKYNPGSFDKSDYMAAYMPKYRERKRKQVLDSVNSNAVNSEEKKRKEKNIKDKNNKEKKLIKEKKKGRYDQIVQDRMKEIATKGGK